MMSANYEPSDAFLTDVRQARTNLRQSEHPEKTSPVLLGHLNDSAHGTETLAHRSPDAAKRSLIAQTNYLLTGMDPHKSDISVCCAVQSSRLYMLIGASGTFLFS